MSGFFWVSTGDGEEVAVWGECVCVGYSLSKSVRWVNGGWGAWSFVTGEGGG